MEIRPTTPGDKLNSGGKSDNIQFTFAFVFLPASHLGTNLGDMPPTV